MTENKREKAVLIKYVGELDPLDIADRALPITGARKEDLMFFMDGGKLHIFVVTNTIINKTEAGGNEKASED